MKTVGLEVFFLNWERMEIDDMTIDDTGYNVSKKTERDNMEEKIKIESEKTSSGDNKEAGLLYDFYTSLKPRGKFTESERNTIQKTSISLISNNKTLAQKVLGKGTYYSQKIANKLSSLGYFGLDGKPLTLPKDNKRTNDLIFAIYVYQLSCVSYQNLANKRYNKTTGKVDGIVGPSFLESLEDDEECSFDSTKLFKQLGDLQAINDEKNILFNQLKSKLDKKVDVKKDETTKMIDAILGSLKGKTSPLTNGNNTITIDNQKVTWINKSTDANKRNMVVSIVVNGTTPVYKISNDDTEIYDSSKKTSLDDNQNKLLSEFVDTVSAMVRPTPDANKPAITPDANKPATTPDANKPATTPDANKPATTPDANKPATTPDANKPATTPDANKPATTPDANKPATTPDANKPATTPDKTTPSSYVESKRVQNKRERFENAVNDFIATGNEKLDLEQKKNDLMSQKEVLSKRISYLKDILIPSLNSAIDNAQNNQKDAYRTQKQETENRVIALEKELKITEKELSKTEGAIGKYDSKKIARTQEKMNKRQEQYSSKILKDIADVQQDVSENKIDEAIDGEKTIKKLEEKKSNKDTDIIVTNQAIDDLFKYDIDKKKLTDLQTKRSTQIKEKETLIDDIISAKKKRFGVVAGYYDLQAQFIKATKKPLETKKQALQKEQGNIEKNIKNIEQKITDRTDISNALNKYDVAKRNNMLNTITFNDQRGNTAFNNVFDQNEKITTSIGEAILICDIEKTGLEASLILLKQKLGESNSIDQSTLIGQIADIDKELGIKTKAESDIAKAQEYVKNIAVRDTQILELEKQTNQFEENFNNYQNYKKLYDNTKKEYDQVSLYLDFLNVINNVNGANNHGYTKVEANGVITFTKAGADTVTYSNKNNTTVDINGETKNITFMAQQKNDLKTNMDSFNTEKTKYETAGNTNLKSINSYIGKQYENIASIGPIVDGSNSIEKIRGVNPLVVTEGSIGSLNAKILTGVGNVSLPATVPNPDKKDTQALLEEVKSAYKANINTINEVDENSEKEIKAEGNQ